MRTALKILIPLLLARVATAAPEWRPLPAAVPAWAEAAAVADASAAAWVWDTAELSHLRCGRLSGPPPEDPAARAAAWRGIFADGPEFRLRLEWSAGSGPVTDFSREIHANGRLTRCRYRLGQTRITRTTLVSRTDRAVLIHVLANQPGSVSFAARLETPPGTGKPRIEDRRQLAAAAPDGTASRVWVLPFESDVASEGGAITLRGEGEALVIWSIARTEAERADLASTLERLGARHDPGHSPPNPATLWHGILEETLKAGENSP